MQRLNQALRMLRNYFGATPPPPVGSSCEARSVPMSTVEAESDIDDSDDKCEAESDASFCNHDADENCEKKRHLKKKRKENAAEINRARNASKAAYERRVEEQSRLLFAKERGVFWELLRIYDPHLACELVVGNETGNDGATSFEFRWQAEQFAHGRSAKFGTVLKARECKHDVLCLVCGAAETAPARASKKARRGVRAATPDEEAQDECPFFEIYRHSPTTGRFVLRNHTEHSRSCAAIASKRGRSPYLAQRLARLVVPVLAECPKMTSKGINTLLSPFVSYSLKLPFLREIKRQAQLLLLGDRLAALRRLPAFAEKLYDEYGCKASVFFSDAAEMRESHIAYEAYRLAQEQ
ncbi:hypothetical protein CTAYLR_009879 [Chrysophaeum taylorii]|uniref:Uncharacterized protein n=1 Tax=Chrysophaeum taylorii TaxID=2483200 RepID=A0AAD7UDE9_9STRA|nr:hypothetical protein CTAYLR_009879 [Chrysophaeum taylorii]